MTSTVSVVLLGIPALKSASESAPMLACLLLGMAASVAGMGLRWRSHRLEQQEKDKIERKADAKLAGGRPAALVGSARSA